MIPSTLNKLEDKLEALQSTTDSASPNPSKSTSSENSRGFEPEGDFNIFNMKTGKNLISNCEPYPIFQEASIWALLTQKAMLPEELQPAILHPHIQGTKISTMIRFQQIILSLPIRWQEGFSILIEDAEGCNLFKDYLTEENLGHYFDFLWVQYFLLCKSVLDILI